MHFRNSEVQSLKEREICIMIPSVNFLIEGLLRMFCSPPSFSALGALPSEVDFEIPLTDDFKIVSLLRVAI